MVLGKLFAALSLVFILLSGCGASRYGLGGSQLCDPTISQMGPDTFYAGANCASASYGMQAAAVFCQRMSRKSLVTNVSGNSDVVFRCLYPGDPELTRPTYQRPPNVIIQDNRNR